MVKNIICLLLTVCVLSGLSSCECDHEWVDATCFGPEECANCGTTKGEPLEHSFMPATLFKPEICEWCSWRRGDELSASELGFDNLEAMGDALIAIEAYSFSSGYVIATGNALKFENGYKLNWGFTVDKSGECTFNSTRNPESYKVVNNDNLDIQNGYENFVISERKTNSLYDYVVFIRKTGPSSFYREEWYVPYSLVDWEEGAAIEESENGGTRYKLHLLSKFDRWEERWE